MGREQTVRLKVVYASTGHVYAAPAPGSRLSEDADTNPRSVYAETKLSAERELSRLCRTHKVPLLVGRVFGLLAPHQAPHYLLPALIERVRTRNVNAIPGLDFVRDYLDARDVCNDLLKLAESPWPQGLYVTNVCSGEAVSIRDLLGRLSMQLGRRMRT